jgi:predicted type IV restriction endonuclease/GTPase SAR1 family protein
MQALFELSEGEKRLQSIISNFPPDSSHWNEAENRFQFVDRLFTECLGWEKPNVRVEVQDGVGGKADYVLGRPAKAVLEVKREAKAFGDLPMGKPTLVRKLEPLMKASHEFRDAVHQVIPYCSLLGAQVAIVCNGPQLAIFQAIIPGQSPLDGECFLFNGFETYLSNFSLMWTLLSPEGISENRAYRDIAIHRNPRIPEKASIAIPEPMRHRYRSRFQENLRDLSGLLLEEIEDNPDLKSAFYRDCYVPIEANNRHLLLSKQIISARYKRVSGDGITPSAIDQTAVLGSASSRPVVVLGDVGVGKTSFFENLFERMDVGERANTYFIHINLGIKANLSKDVKTFVLLEIPAVLRKKYGVDINSSAFVDAIYHEEIRAFDDSVKGRLKTVDQKAYEKEKIGFLSAKIAQQDNHLMAAFGHIVRGRGKQIIIVMDNADQRGIAIQQEAFLISQELASWRNLLIFIALRPSTFYDSKTTGALSGYQNKILTISPPPADEVVQRRLTFAVRVAEGRENLGKLEGIRLQLGSVVAFLNATLRSVRSNQAIRQFLSNISSGNTRSVMELITSFCGSPNVDSEKIVRIEEETSGYKVPLHEFTKHALLGEYAYYNAQSSLVAQNVYDVSSADSREHFLASLIVSYLSSSTGEKDSDGFVLGEFIVAEMLRHGFIEDQTRNALRRLAAKRLIETPYAHFRELKVHNNQLPDQFHFRATSVGIYHVKHWMGTFAFLDATSTDTPIFDEDCRSLISNLAPSFEIADRYKRATEFRDYLEGQWHLANISVKYFDFPAILRLQEDSFNVVKGVVDKKPFKVKPVWRKR